MTTKITKDEFRCEHRHTAYEHPCCWRKFEESNVDFKVGYFDIEASRLKADFGWMISWVIKHAGEDKFEGYVLKESDYKANVRDKKCVAELVKALGKFDKVVTYYGSRFDIPFSRTRALIHGLQFIPPKTIQHLDLYYHVRGKLQLSRNRLMNAGEALGLEMEKTRIGTRIWSNVGLAYSKKELDYIWEHNVKDTILLEELHEVLKPYIPPRRAYL